MMHNTCLNSAVSLRCRYSPSSQFNDPTYFLDARFDSNPLLISSSYSSCCCCCCCCAANSNLIYNRVPRINPRNLCNGFRQSTLIQFSPSKRLIFQGSKRQTCNTTSGFSSLTDSDRNYYFDKLHSFKEKRKLGKVRCWGIEDNKKEQSFSNAIDDYVDDVEILLDLLTEEVGLENISVRERKLINKKDHKTKTLDSVAVKRDLKRDNKSSKVQSVVRKEDNRKEEERRTLVKRANREHKKEGSSCSSYYSVSSSGEFDIDNDVEIKHDVEEKSSSEHKDDQRMDSYKSYDEENVDRRKESSKEKTEILKKNNSERYYGNEEWRKKSEKKLNLESSQQQSQVSVSQHSEKNNRITNQSQSQMKYERLKETSKTDNKVDFSSHMQKVAENKLNTSIQKLTAEKDAYRRNSEVSGIHEIDMKEEASSSSSYKGRMKNQEHNSTEVNSHVEDKREEKQERINQLTTLQESRVKSEQISRISDTQITKTENSSFSQTQSNIKNEKQELHLEASSSSQKVEGTTELMKTGRKTTKASSFHVGMPKEASSNYKALKLNPETNLQESGAQLQGHSSEQFETINESSRSRIQQSEILREDINSDVIDSANQEHKSSSDFVGEFVKNASNKLLASQEQEHEETHEQDLGYEDSDKKDGPSDEMWHVSDNTLSESSRKSGRSLWNVIGDVIRLRWSSSSRTETHAIKSGGEKASSNKSSSEAWFSGHEHEDSDIDNKKMGIKKDQSRRRVDDSPLLSSSSNPNHGSSSKTMSPSVIEESSFPVPAIRMRRSPVVKDSGIGEIDASGSGKMVKSPEISPSFSSGKMVNTTEISPSSSSGKMVKSTEISPSSSSGKMVKSTEISPSSSSGKMVNMTEISPSSSGGKMVISEEPVSAGELKRRKLARIDQVSKDRFDEWEEAYDIETKQRKIDEFFMKEALLEAKKGADFWEVPVGAVLVHDGKVIARGYNLVEELRDSTAHAEMICIREASNNLHSWRLSGTTLYVTLEPCPMCAGAILQARIDTVVWGAPNKLLGADGSWIRLFPDGDGGNGSEKPAAPVHPFHPNMKVRRGVLSSECADVMQQFFQLRRKKKEKKIEDEPPTPPPSCLPITHHHHPSKFFSKMHNAFNIMFCL
ncbi:hypothetical protein L2E82_13920 [Cichorium intybus]|uniref:Uncharacterized protein n=1 Tax=Cichorium intybus TaxID=13427 RepID=A0ACB9EYJ8_CICIN|nr:hypothetical protein L2E82_13920 [Cichorium intybus]